MRWKGIIAIVAVILMTIFVMQNMEVVRVRFLIWQLEASRIVIYLAVFLIGVFTGWLGKSLRWL